MSRFQIKSQVPFGFQSEFKNRLPPSPDEPEAAPLKYYLHLYDLVFGCTGFVQEAEEFGTN